MWHFGFQVAGWPSKRLIKWQLYSIKRKKLWDFPYKCINQSLQRQTIEQFTKCVIGRQGEEGPVDWGRINWETEAGWEFSLSWCVQTPWLWTFPLCPAFVQPSSKGTPLPKGKLLGPCASVCVCVFHTYRVFVHLPILHSIYHQNFQVAGN